jgi:hypothetical protein
MTWVRLAGLAVALRILGAGAFAAALAWAFAAYFRPDLLVAFATWVQSCF